MPALRGELLGNMNQKRNSASIGMACLHRGDSPQLRLKSCNRHFNRFFFMKKTLVILAATCSLIGLTVQSSYGDWQRDDIGQASYPGIFSAGQNGYVLQSSGIGVGIGWKADNFEFVASTLGWRRRVYSEAHFSSGSRRPGRGRVDGERRFGNERGIFHGGSDDRRQVCSGQPEQGW